MFHVSSLSTIENTILLLGCKLEKVSILFQKKLVSFSCREQGIQVRQQSVIARATLVVRIVVLDEPIEARYVSFRVLHVGHGAEEQQPHQTKAPLHPEIHGPKHRADHIDENRFQGMTVQRGTGHWIVEFVVHLVHVSVQPRYLVQQKVHDKEIRVGKRQTHAEIYERIDNSRRGGLGIDDFQVCVRCENPR